MSNFVVHDGLGGRVVIHRAGCALLDRRYDDGGERHDCDTLAAARQVAQRLAGSPGWAFHICGWCRPDPPH